MNAELLNKINLFLQNTQHLRALFAPLLAEIFQFFVSLVRQLNLLSRPNNFVACHFRHFHESFARRLRRVLLDPVDIHLDIATSNTQSPVH